MNAILTLIVLYMCGSLQWAQASQKLTEETNVSSLAELEEFRDVVVIQRRFLPKTGRFEFLGGGGAVLNDPFFTSLGASTRFGYYFSEFLGIELNAVVWGTTERQVTTDLKEKRRVKASALVSPLSYVGLDVKWSPFFGKIAYLDGKIIPFDFYYSLGGGATKTSQGASASTLHLGTGQIFAFSKAIAFRWDVSWNMFVMKKNPDGTGAEGMQHNLYITLGASFFFPGVDYR